MFKIKKSVTAVTAFSRSLSNKNRGKIHFSMSTLFSFPTQWGSEYQAKICNTHFKTRYGTNLSRLGAFLGALQWRSEYWAQACLGLGYDPVSDLGSLSNLWTGSGTWKPHIILQWRSEFWAQVHLNTGH